MTGGFNNAKTIGIILKYYYGLRTRERRELFIESIDFRRVYEFYKAMYVPTSIFSYQRKTKSSCAILRRQGTT